MYLFSEQHREHSHYCRKFCWTVMFKRSVCPTSPSVMVMDCLSIWGGGASSEELVHYLPGPSTHLPAYFWATVRRPVIGWRCRLQRDVIGEVIACTMSQAGAFHVLNSLSLQHSSPRCSHGFFSSLLSVLLLKCSLFSKAFPDSILYKIAIFTPPVAFSIPLIFFHGADHQPTYSTIYVLTCVLAVSLQ